MKVKQKRANIVTAVNSANVSKADGVYTVRDVVAVVDDIVMNGRLYPAAECAAAASGLEGRPAPAGHPKDSKGRHISVNSGQALASSWIGAYCANARHEGGRSMVDVVINEAQAKALPSGAEVIARLDAAIEGTNTEPIHVSTGVFVREIAANGESRGKKYTAIATDLTYDHLAILVNEIGAATPAQGVGMFVNAQGEDEEIDASVLDDSPADLRGTGAMSWLKRLLGVNSEMSFDEIHSAIRKALPEGAWPVEVYQREVIFIDRDNALWRQSYSLSDGAAVMASEPEKVQRKVEYKPLNNSQEIDPMKDAMILALNAAGVKTEGLSDAEILAAHSALTMKPITEALKSITDTLAANSQSEVKALAATIAAAPGALLKAEELEALPVARLRELAANAAKPNGKAAPVLPGAATQDDDEEKKAFMAYSVNADLKAASGQQH